jgi:hypothetical protein
VSEDNFNLWISFESFKINILADMNVEIANATSNSRGEIFNGDNIVFSQKTFAKFFEIEPLSIAFFKGIIKIESINLDDCFSHEYPEKSKGHLSVACAQPPKQLGVYASKLNSSF